ncbi:hypothetical protein [Candidatus Xianfuyuplasma coldseepsis]|uniref:Uncharacterized protein n=1 Tax=Candidatus Xianfuyuplasma coldseepsis TaxID=2782163 RepID=A0A7L7KRC6_9MOLU|nr:hypothetical protein [Xianfuyuplasma coldseepsis]QMS85381.1 hypothetical protein G4Z02_06315 [Xianfuyuplasma coldseepsis]
MDYIVARELNYLYIYLDIVFLVILGYFLIRKNRLLAFWFGVAGALIYFVVDYGGFYLLLGTRNVDGAHTMWFLLWLSTSYGFTNFVWIWLFLDRDKSIRQWSLLIVGGWLLVAFVSQSLGQSFGVINISRMTGSYHWFMLLILVIGYGFYIYQNWGDNNLLKQILYLLFIGIVVQFSWEAVLLVSGIRPLGMNPIVFNSLLETNLGIPYLYFIHRYLVTKRELVPA